MVAVGVAYYERYPYAGEHTKDNAETGIQWDRGEYLSARPSDIDFAALRAEFCEPYEQKGNSFPIEIREVLSRVENIEAETLGDAIDKAMELHKKSVVVLDAGDFRDVSYLPAKAESR